MPDYGHRIKSYLNYRFKRIGPHSAHSPYIFQYLTQKLPDDFQSMVHTIETTIENKIQEDLLAKTISIRKLDRNRFYRYASLEQPINICETGTGVGVSAFMLSSLPSVKKGFSIDHNPDRIALAKEHFSYPSSWKFKKMEVLELLQLKFEEKFDWIFIDAWHKKESVLLQTEWAKQNISDEGFIILHDIYWSKDMTEAWESVRQSADFHLTIDQYSFGILSKRPSFREKQHFVL